MVYTGRHGRWYIPGYTHQGGIYLSAQRLLSLLKEKGNLSAQRLLSLLKEGVYLSAKRLLSLP